MAVARNFAGELRVGDVVVIEGPLGAGKTAFARGLADGLGADPGDVSSPTFTLLQHYAGRVPLSHADLYRLSPAEAADLGLEEAGLDGVLAVEWPDRWQNAPADAWRVTIHDDGETRRTIEVWRPAV